MPMLIKTAGMAILAALLGSTTVGCGADATVSEGRTAAAGAKVPVRQPANHIQKLPAEAILRRTYTAARQAAGVTVSGTFSGDDGIRNYRFRLTGRGLRGYVTTATFGSVDVTAINGQVFLRAGAALTNSLLPPGQAAAAAGKWLQIPAAAARESGLMAWSDKASYLDTMLEPHLTAQLRKVPVTRRADQQVVGLTESDTGTLWVATRGKPYPVQITPQGRSKATVSLSEWNPQAPITRPSRADTVIIAE